MANDFLLVAHILLLVAWLGIDVGVFYSSFVMRRPGLSTETRLQVRKIMVTLDLAPRLSLILMIPVGLGLAHLTGWGFNTVNVGVAVALLWVVTIVALGWCWGTVVMFGRRQIKPKAKSVQTFDRLDWSGRVVFSITFLLLGATSLIGWGPFDPLWLALKSTLFGLVIAAGLWIRVAARRYRPALTELLDKGESPQLLTAVNQAIRGVYPAVISVWTMLVAMVFLAVFRP